MTADYELCNQPAPHGDLPPIEVRARMVWLPPMIVDRPPGFPGYQVQVEVEE